MDIDDGDEPDENIETENKTFVNPSQVVIISCKAMFKCDKCEFEATTKAEIRSHKESEHFWCNICYSTKTK